MNYCLFEEELVYVVDNLDVKVVFVDVEYVEKFENVCGVIFNVKYIIVFDGMFGFDMLLFDDLLEGVELLELDIGLEEG